MDQLKSGRIFKACIVVVCGWTLIEVPLELDGSAGPIYVFAVLASKVLMCLIGWGAIAKLRYATEVFSFICAVSVFAIAPALPFEYIRCIPVALTSTIECLAKVVCVALFLVTSMTRESIEADLKY
jgi:hypothetical protein